MILLGPGDVTAVQVLQKLATDLGALGVRVARRSVALSDDHAQPEPACNLVSCSTKG